MREGFRNKFVTNEDGKLIGISLGIDFTAEHEWGIEGIEREFGIRARKPGIAGRAITKSKLFWTEDEQMAGFSTVGEYRRYHQFAGRPMSMDDALDAASLSRPRIYGNSRKAVAWHSNLQTAWDKNGFAAFSAASSEHEALRKVYQAFCKLDGIIVQGATHGLLRGALLLGIRSRIPNDILS